MKSVGLRQENLYRSSFDKKNGNNVSFKSVSCIVDVDYSYDILIRLELKEIIFSVFKNVKQLLVLMNNISKESLILVISTDTTIGTKTTTSLSTPPPFPPSSSESSVREKEKLARIIIKTESIPDELYLTEYFNKDIGKSNHSTFFNEIKDLSSFFIFGCKEEKILLLLLLITLFLLPLVHIIEIL